MSALRHIGVKYVSTFLAFILLCAAFFCVLVQCMMSAVISLFRHDHLRCRHSFLVVKASSSQLYVWHGESSPPKVRSLAASVAEKLSAR